MTDGLAGKDAGHPGRDPPHPARRLLPHPRRRVHAHPGARRRSSGSSSTSKGSPSPLPPDEQRHILGRLNAAEAFERFLHTRYVGQKRFGLEGAESAIVLLDTVLDEAAATGLHEAVHGHGPPGPAQRAGQHRGQVLRRDLRGVRGQPRSRLGPGFGRRQVPQGGDRGSSSAASGGTIAGDPGLQPLAPRGGRPGGRGHGPGQAGPRAASERRTRRGASIPSPCSPSCCTATPPSPARAWWPRPSTCRAWPATAPAAPSTSSSTTSSASPPRRSRPARRCTPPTWPRWSRPRSSTSTATIPRPAPGPPAWPSASARHSTRTSSSTWSATGGTATTRATTPATPSRCMYALIEAKRSVRKLYTEALVRRGDITLDEAEQALDDFSARLQAALDETRPGGAAPADRRCPRRRPRRARPAARRSRPGWTPTVLSRLAAEVRTVPAGLRRPPQAGPAVRAAGQGGGRRRGRLGPRRGPGLSARCCSRAPTSASPARTPGGAPSPSATPCWSTTRPAPSTCPWPRLAGAGRFSVYDSLLSEYAARRLRVRLLGGGPGRPGRLGGPVRRLRERRPDHHRQVPGGGRGQVGPDVRAWSCCCPTATRARAPSTPRPASSGS